MKIQDKSIYLNKLCNLTFLHVCIDGSHMVRKVRLFIDETNLNRLDDERLIYIDIIGDKRPKKLKLSKQAKFASGLYTRGLKI